MITDLCPSASAGNARPRTAAPNRPARSASPPAPAVAAPEPDHPAPGGPRTGSLDAGNGNFTLRLYLRDLANAAAAGPPADSREALVLEQLPRVVRLAFDYQGCGLPLGDLISEGNLGLLRAAELFDPGRAVRFSYYAKPWIRVQMQRAVSYQAWPVSLPADFSRHHSQVRGAEERLTARLDRPPADAEVAGECGLDLPAVRRLRATPAPSFLPLESPWPDHDSGMTLEEIIPDEAAPAPDREAIRGGDRELINSLLAQLTATEQTAIRLRYGLEDGVSRTLEEVGRSLGCGRQGAHRVEQAALAKMRAGAEAPVW